MKTKMKALTLVLCAVMLVATTVFVTVAYLTSTTETVTNTFTVGNVVITLDELDVDSDDNENDNVEYTVNGQTVIRDRANSYKLMPGHNYTKDPTVHVKAKSEKCYLFIKVTNDISGIEVANSETGVGTTAAQIAANGWVALDGFDNVYYLNRTIDASESETDIDVAVFASFKIDGAVENAQLATYENKTITVQAYAIQADGFGTAIEAWTAAPSDWVADATSGN